MIKKYLCRSFLTCLVLAGSLFAGTTASASNDSWSIYLYLCGSDLESEDGAASEDLSEIMSADLPDNVTVVVMTGGASQWQNEVVDPSVLEYYVRQNDTFDFVNSEELANMGDTNTLTNFLEYCHENYPADHEAVIFWNHGGGTASGVSFDENYDYDYLTLTELEEAFSNVYSKDTDNPPLEMIGFDTCLMATLETADLLSGYANYMVASEESEPGCGWYYTSFLDALGEDTSISGGKLGEYICDSFIEFCQDYGVDSDVTLSVIDLAKIPALVSAYENLGEEALLSSCYDPSFLSSLAQNAQKSNNFGGNSKSEGYTDMVDLGDLISRNSDLLPNTAQKVLDALDEAVVYKVSGPYAGANSGISCFYALDGDTDSLEAYTAASGSVAFENLYQYLLTGDLDNSYLESITNGTDISWMDESITSDYILPENIEQDSIVTWQSFDEDEEYEYPVYISDEGYATMELDEDTMNQLQGIYMHTLYLDEEEDLTIWLGRDVDMYADWDEGIFQDNFTDLWGSIDGNLCYMDIIYEEDDFIVFTVPILLNGEEYQLRVVYDYDYDEYEILGARRGLDDNGMSDKNLVQLQPGDEITTLLYAGTLYGDDELELVEIDTFEVTEDTSFYDEEMGDGTFAVMFELVDIRNESRYSDPVYVTVEDGEIYLEME